MRLTADFMIAFISSSVMREYSGPELHVGQSFPAYTFSIGPLRKASATMALVVDRLDG
jgi:hypothetical protein